MTQDPIFKAISALSRLATELMPLPAIWLDKPLQMEGKRSIRIAAGDCIRVDATNNYNDPTFNRALLIDCGEHYGPTHEITALRGNLYNTMFEVDLKDLKTGDLITITL
jgi:hypothetical protein